MDAADAMNQLPDGYAPLLRRVLEVSAADDRIRAVWLGGSLARGDADQSSDLDVMIAVADEAFDAFVTDWKQWLANITSTVIARPLPFAPGSFYSVTPTMERLDVVTERVSALANTFHRTRLAVLDKDDCATMVPPPWPSLRPAPATLAGIIEEFYRDYAMFPVVVDRQDWLLGIEAVGVVRGLLYKLYVEANAPQPMMGVKRWSDKLTAKQRAVLESLPSARANPDDVRRVHEEVSLTFVREARAIASTFEVVWPDDLHACVVGHLRARSLPHLAEDSAADF